DDSGSFLASGSHPGRVGREADELALGAFSPLQYRLYRARGTAGPDRFRARRRLPAAWVHRVHRTDRSTVVGNRIVAHHELSRKEPGEFTGNAFAASCEVGASRLVGFAALCVEMLRYNNDRAG